MENLHRTTFDNQLIELDSVDSTNNYAMGQIHEGMAFDGLVCLAHHQTAGKGQRGKTWISEPGQNLNMSLVIVPQTLDLSLQFLFSASVSLGIIDLVRKFYPNNWSIKWPNDIYWNDRKAAGILIESVIQGNEWLYAVAGIGINLNQDSFDPEIQNAVSIYQITGGKYEAIPFAKELVPFVQMRIARLRVNPEEILMDFNQNLYKKDFTVDLKMGRDLFETRILGVDSKGSLLTTNGSFNWGEVEWIVKK